MQHTKNGRDLLWFSLVLVGSLGQACLTSPTASVHGGALEEEPRNSDSIVEMGWREGPDEEDQESDASHLALCDAAADAPADDDD